MRAEHAVAPVAGPRSLRSLGPSQVNGTVSRSGGATMSADPKAWRWQEGSVDRSSDHFELRYGSAEEAGWGDWLPVALVGRSQPGTFAVQFLINQHDQPGYAEIIQHVKSELDFYLVEKREPDPWGYAQDHCGTGANVYSSVHWSYFPKE